MKKLRNDNSGFSAVEVILVIVIVALIGAVGYMVYKNHHKPTTTASVTTTVAPKPTIPTSATSTKTTTALVSSSDGKIKLTLPSTWELVNNANNSQVIGNLNNNPSCFDANDTNPCTYYTYFAPKAYSSSLLWFLAAEKTTETPQQAVEQIIGTPQSSDIVAQSSNQINGYDAYYIEYKTPNVDSYYAIADNGYVVLLQNGQLDSQSDPNTILNSSSSPYVADFQSIVNSINLSL